MHQSIVTTPNPPVRDLPGHGAGNSQYFTFTGCAHSAGKLHELLLRAKNSRDKGCVGLLPQYMGLFTRDLLQIVLHTMGLIYTFF